jgi:hypothetical protein
MDLSEITITLLIVGAMLALAGVTGSFGLGLAVQSTAEVLPIYLRGWLRSNAIASSRFLSDILNNTLTVCAIYTGSHAGLQQ